MIHWTWFLVAVLAALVVGMMWAGFVMGHELGDLERLRTLEAKLSRWHLRVGTPGQPPTLMMGLVHLADHAEFAAEDGRAELVRLYGGEESAVPAYLWVVSVDEYPPPPNVRS